MNIYYFTNSKNLVKKERKVKEFFNRSIRGRIHFSEDPSEDRSVEVESVFPAVAEMKMNDTNPNQAERRTALFIRPVTRS